jgi:ABC-type nitrate/sulfonate/bicarbonate transport system substrate-binding protein
MVAAASPVETMADLRGRKVAVSFGSTPHIHAVRWLKEAGLRPGQDVTLLNLGTGELEPALAGGQVDGIVYWEPNISQIVGKLGARVVRSGAYTVAVVMRKDFLAAHREAAVRLLAAMRRAVLYMARNKDQVNGWFAEASRVDPGLIHQGSLHTPIYQVEGLADVSLEVTPEILATFQDSADFYLEQGERSERLPVREHVDFELWEEARRRTEADGFDVGAIRVKG